MNHTSYSNNHYTNKAPKKKPPSVTEQKSRKKISQKKPAAVKINFDHNDHKKLRRIGHQLKPILTLSEQGITPGLINEFKARLDDHELIKIKLQINDRTAREQLIQELALLTSAQLIQKIGKVAIFMLPAKKHPKCSNLVRYQNI